MADKKYIVRLDTDQLSKDKAKAKSLLSDLSTDVQSSGKKIDSTFQSIGKTIAAVGAGIAVKEIISNLYNFSQQFNKSMLEVSTISKTVTDDMKGFKEQILGLTTEIPISADNAAKALYQIVSAGYDGADGMRVLEVAAKAAVGGVTETTTAADAITTLLNAYKLGVDEAENVSDMLFTTVKLGKTTMGELGKSISQVAPLAAAFGVEMDQVLSAVATLTKSGTPTAQAMTQIRSALTASTKVLGDGYYATHTFQEGLAEIATMAGGSESKLRELVPEVEAMNGILGVTGINAQTAAADLYELNNALGASEEAYSKMLDDANSQLTLLKNNVLSTFADIGNGLTVSVADLAKYLNEAFESGDIEETAKAVMLLVATLGTYKATAIATQKIKLFTGNLENATQVEELQKLIVATQQAGTTTTQASNADLQAAVSKGQLTQAQADGIAMLRAEIQANIDAMAIEVQKATLDVANAKQAVLNTGQEITATQTKIQSLQVEQAQEIANGNTTKANTISETINTESKRLNALQSRQKAQAQQLSNLQTAVENKEVALNTAQQQLNTIATTKGTAAKGLFALATNKVTAAFKTLKLAFASNPIGLLITLLTTAATAMMLFKSKTDETVESLSEVEQATRDYEKAITDERAKIQRLADSVANTNIPMEQRLKDLKELKSLIPDYNAEITKEGTIINNNTTAIEEYIKAKEEEIKLKIYETQLQDLYTQQISAQDAIKNIESKPLADAMDNAQYAESLVKQRETSLALATANLERVNGEIAAINESINGNLSGTATTGSTGNGGSGGDTSPLAGTIKAYEDDIKELKKLQEETSDAVAYAELEAKIKENEEAIKKIKGESADELTKLTKSATEESEKLELELLSSGTDSKVKQLENERDAKLEEIEKSRKAYEDAYKKEYGSLEGADFSAWESQSSAVTKIADINIGKAEEEEQEKSLSNFKTFASRYEELAKQHIANKEAIEKQGGTDTDNKLEDDSYESQLDTLNDEVLNSLEGFEGLAEAVTKKNVDEIIKLLKEAKEALVAEGANEDAVKMVDAEIAKLGSGEFEMSPSQRSLEEWQDMESQLSSCVRSFEEIEETVGGVAGEIISTAGSIATSTISMISGIAQFAEISMAATKTSAITTSATVQAVEKASVILAIISAVIQVAMLVASLFSKDNSEEVAETQEALQDEIDALQWYLDNEGVRVLRNNDINMLTTYRDILKETTAEVNSQYTFASGLAGLFEQWATAAERAGLIAQATTEAMVKAAANISYSDSNLIGESRYTDVTDQMTTMAEQYDALQGKIDAEKSKTGKNNDIDWDNITEWEQEMEELGAEMVEVVNEVFEGIMGGTSYDIASDLGEAFIDAFAAGEDAALAWGDTVNDIVGDILKQMLIADLLEEEVSKIFDEYKENWYSDGVFAGFDAVINDLPSLADDLNGVMTNLSEELENLDPDLLALLGLDDSSRTSTSSSGITASQESVDSVDGRLTVMQAHTSYLPSISSEVSLIRQLIETGSGGSLTTSSTSTISQDISDLKTNAGKIMETLSGIKQDTENLGPMREDIETMKTSIQTMETKGLKLRT